MHGKNEERPISRGPSANEQCKNPFQVEAAKLDFNRLIDSSELGAVIRTDIRTRRKRYLDYTIAMSMTGLHADVGNATTCFSDPTGVSLQAMLPFGSPQRPCAGKTKSRKARNASRD